MTAAARITLFSRPDCHLCDVAREVVETVSAEFDMDYDEVDIQDDPFNADRYAARIPVVMVDGVEVAQFRISPDVLRRALRRD